MNLEELADIAEDAVTSGVDLIRRTPPGAITAKGDRDYATEVDFAVEDHLRSLLAAATPDIPVIGEERANQSVTTSRWWALDPIDGTVNFAHGLPLTGISLALYEDGEPVVGIVDLPFLNERYRGVRSAGATCNGEAIAVSAVNDLSQAVVALGDYAVGENAAGKNSVRLAITEVLVGSVLRVRMLGAATIDLTWLARGRIDANIMLSNQPWDVGAGVIIAREAGAEVYDIDRTRHNHEATATIGAHASLAAELFGLIETASAAGLR